jgi:carbamoyl-phosphate synthase large subunit
VGLIAEGRVAFVVNTPRGSGSRSDGQAIRKAANVHLIPSVTTVDAALAAVHGLLEQGGLSFNVKSLQEYLAEGRDRQSRSKLERRSV